MGNEMISEKDLCAFKNRQLKAKDLFFIKEVSKNTCYEFVRRYHYLGNAKFFCVYGYGLFYKNQIGFVEMVGCATYSNPQGSVSLKGWFGIPNDCTDILELSRLCLIPCLNGTNATSFLLGNSMKMLRKYSIKAVITLADSSRHIGSIYQVCNFKYYGLTERKTDFYTFDGYKNPRGKVANIHGVWIERPQKHRYCYLLDKNLKVLYQQQKPPCEKDKHKKTCCCENGEVFDKRFNEWYSCPVCSGYIQKIRSCKNEPRYIIKNTTEYKNDGQLSLF